MPDNGSVSSFPGRKAVTGRAKHQTFLVSADFFTERNGEGLCYSTSDSTRLSTLGRLQQASLVIAASVGIRADRWHTGVSTGDHCLGGTGTGTGTGNTGTGSTHRRMIWFRIKTQGST
jgi:hypothetical protein